MHTLVPARHRRGSIIPRLLAHNRSSTSNIREDDGVGRIPRLAHSVVTSIAFWKPFPCPPSSLKSQVMPESLRETTPSFDSASILEDLGPSFFQRPRPRAIGGKNGENPTATAGKEDNNTKSPIITTEAHPAWSYTFALQMLAVGGR